MNKKDKNSDNSKEKGNPTFPALPADLEKTANAPPSFAIPKKNEAPVKARSPVTWLRDKFSQLMGGSQGTSHPLVSPHGFNNKDPAKPDKAALHPDMPETTFNRGISKMDAALNAGGKAKVMSPDITSLSERLSELEEHTREMHAAFDEFVLKSDKFMDYGQFIEVRKEVEEKIRLLDKIEKSLQDSKDQILKDSGYMDSILGGFKYTKKRIGILETRMDSLSKAEQGENHPSILNKIRGAVDPQNVKSRIDSSKLSDLSRTVSELKRQIDALKQHETDIQKEVETLKEKGSVPDNNLPENVKSLNKEIDDIKEKMSGYSDSRELAMIKKEIIELGVKVDKSDKRYLEIVKGEDAKKEIKTAMSELKKEMNSKVDALRGAQHDVVGREEFAEFMKENKMLISRLQRDDDVRKRIKTLEKNMKSISRGAGKSHANILGRLLGKKRDDASCAIVPGMDKHILELSRQVEDVRKNDEKVQQELKSMKGKMVSQEALEAVRSHMNYLSKAEKQNIDERKLKKEIEDEINNRTDVDAKVKIAVGDVMKEMNSKVDALCRAENTWIGKDEIDKFVKGQDELKNEISKLKRDIGQIPAMQSSMEQISLAVNSLREEPRKEVDNKSMQSIDRGAHDDDIAEVRSNIEKLKAMTQDL